MPISTRSLHFLAMWTATHAYIYCNFTANNTVLSSPGDPLSLFSDEDAGAAQSALGVGTPPCAPAGSVAPVGGGPSIEAID